MFGSLYPDEDDQLEEEEPTYDIADYEEVDEGLSGEVFNYNEEEVEYVDFLDVEDFLDSSNNDVGEFYTDEENYMFIKEVTADPFLSIFMACGREKEQDIYGKSEEAPSDVLGFHDKHRSMLMMKIVAFIVGCYFVLILRKGDWDELTGYPKDHGKDRPNSRVNSLQPREDDVDQKTVQSLFVTAIDRKIELSPAFDRPHASKQSQNLCPNVQSY